MNKETINWGIISTGRIAREMTDALKLVKDAQLIAVSSRDVERAAAFSREYDLMDFYGDYKEMLQDEAIDLVYVATPHPFHYENTLACLNAGKAVLCEKPMAMDKKQAAKMIKTARKKKVFFMEALWTNFLPSFITLQEKLTEMGDIRYLNADFAFPAPHDPNGRLLNKELGGGALLDIGIYVIFAAYKLMGMPETIKAQGYIGKTGVDEQTSIIFKYKNGGMANLFCSLQVNSKTNLSVYTPNGMVELGHRFHMPALPYYYRDIQKPKKMSVKMKGNGYNYEAEHVNGCLKAGLVESPVWSFDDCLSVNALIEEVKKQIGLKY